LQKYLSSELSISKLGILNEMFSYGSAAKTIYWYFSSGASSYKLLIFVF